MLVVALAVLTGLVTLADWAGIVRRVPQDVQQWTRPAPLVLLTATTVAAGALEHSAGRWLVLALACGALGDVLLVDATERRFVAGLAAFLVGHLAYVAAFLSAGLNGGWWWAGGAVVVLTALTIARGVLPGALRSGGPALAVPVAVYMAVIAAMTATGWATGCWLIAAGSAVFVASDTQLAINRFVGELPWAKLPTIATYHVGQGLIAVGVLLLTG